MEILEIMRIMVQTGDNQCAAPANRSKSSPPPLTLRLSPSSSSPPPPTCLSTGAASFALPSPADSTPRAVYTALAAGANLNWERWQIFWSDERCVPPTSPDSNYRMAKDTLLDPLTRQGDAPRMVVRLAGEGEPEAAAAAYERAVREPCLPTLIPARAISRAST